MFLKKCSKVAALTRSLPFTVLAVQDGNYSDANPKTAKRATIGDLLKFGTDELKLDYIFWCTEEPYYSNELIPFMQPLKRG